MKSWKGRLKRGTVGGWTLEADDGQRHRLLGRIPASLEGQRVEARGHDSLPGVIRVEELRPATTSR
jgi:hypothetical protein